MYSLLWLISCWVHHNVVNFTAISIILVGYVLNDNDIDHRLEFHNLKENSIESAKTALIMAIWASYQSTITFEKAMLITRAAESWYFDIEYIYAERAIPNKLNRVDFIMIIGTSISWINVKMLNMKFLMNHSNYCTSETMAEH